MSEKKSNIFIFHGEDDFTLQKKIERWKEEFTKKFGTTGVVVIDGSAFNETDLVGKLQQLSSPSLFASKKLVLAQNCLPTKASQEILMELILKLIQENSPDNFFVFYSAKLDRRLGSIKKILSAGANVVEFELPHGQTLNGWLKAYAKQMGSELDDPGAEKLAKYLGRDLFEEKKYGGRVVERKEAFNLWEAYSELSKLSAYTSNINSSAVEALVVPKVLENIFNLSDNLLKKNKRDALSLIENLFLDQSTDEKSTAIKIIGLLAEQIKSLLLVITLKKDQLSNQEIADTLGWSSGRVFMVGKQSESADLSSLKQMLRELLAIDLSLKTSDVNPKLLIGRFVNNFA